MSAGPPGPNGTTILTGLLGQDCAAAGAAKAATAPIRRPSLASQRMLSSLYPIPRRCPAWFGALHAMTPGEDATQVVPIDCAGRQRSR